MKILDRLFTKHKTKPNEAAHAVVEKKTAEAKVILEDIKKKMERTATIMEKENKRNTIEVNKKVKELRDVAKYIAIITGGKEVS